MTAPCEKAKDAMNRATKGSSPSFRPVQKKIATRRGMQLYHEPIIIGFPTKASARKNVVQI